MLDVAARVALVELDLAHELSERDVVVLQLEQTAQSFWNVAVAAVEKVPGRSEREGSARRTGNAR